MIKSRLIILLSAVMALVASCTYDYFLDNANYQVYIPQVDNGEVDDCIVLIYDDDGNLVGKKHWTPGSDPRMDEGLFAFDLPPGHYTTYIYTDVDSSFDIDDIDKLKPDPNKPGIPGIPGTPLVPGTSFSVKVPDPDDPDFKDGSYPPVPNGKPKTGKVDVTVPPVGPMQTDTIDLKNVPGRITVRFTRLETPIDLIAKATVEVSGIGTRWYVGGDYPVTDPDRPTIFTVYDPVIKGEDGNYLLIFDDYYFPSIPGETIVFTFRFYDEDGNLLRERIVRVLDDNRQPMTLHQGDWIIIDVGDQGFTIELRPWNPDIFDGGNIGSGIL